MKTAKKYSQKGLSPIAIVIILAVLGVGALVFYNSTNQKNTSSNSQQAQVNSDNNTQQSKLEKIETEKYTFYFPSGYIPSSTKPQASTVLYYSPVNSKDEGFGLGISLAIQPLQKRITAPSEEFCKEAAQIQAKNTAAVVVRAKSIDEGQSHGCEFVIAAKNTKDESIINQKQLWYKEKEDVSIYAVHTLYLGSMPQEEKDNLDSAVEKFTLK